MGDKAQTDLVAVDDEVSEKSQADADVGRL